MKVGIISEYETLRDLNPPMTPQGRGQAFNGFIARLLRSYGHRARADNRTDLGEIDVACEILNQRFLLEAKWEEKKTSEGALMKLSGRVNQRLAGTIGVFVSMAGYTAHALANLTVGRRLDLLLLTREHVDALVYGFIDPDGLFGHLLDAAHFRGAPLTTMERLADPPNLDSVVWGDPVATLSTARGVSVTTVVRCAETMKGPRVIGGEIAVRLSGFFYSVNAATKKLSPMVRIPGFLRSLARAGDGAFVLSRGEALARLSKEGGLEILSGIARNDPPLLLVSTTTGDILCFSRGIPSIGSRPAYPGTLTSTKDPLRVMELDPAIHDVCVIAPDDQIAGIAEGRPPEVVLLDRKGVEIRRLSIPGVTSVQIAAGREGHVLISGTAAHELVPCSSGRPRYVVVELDTATGHSNMIVTTSNNIMGVTDHIDGMNYVAVVLGPGDNPGGELLKLISPGRQPAGGSIVSARQ